MNPASPLIPQPSILRHATRPLIPTLLLAHLSSVTVDAHAEDKVPPRPEASAAAGAYDVLDAHCSRCHQRGRQQPPYAATGLTNILALDELARDPSLVRPGLPDGSALYTSVLRRAMPPEAALGDAVSMTRPTAEEVEALRAWIDDLPPAVAPQCSRSAAPGRRIEADRLLRALRGLPPAVAARMRFVSLAHIERRCPGPSQRAWYREGLVQLGARLAKSGAAAANGPGEDGTLVLTIDLERIGWTSGDWDRLVESYPLAASVGTWMEPVRRATQSRVPVVRGDWLAHRLLRDPDPREPAHGEAGEARLANGFDPTLYPIAALARLWERGVDFETAAAELGLSAGQLARALDGLPGELGSAARRLRQGLLPRGEFVALASALAGAKPPSDTADTRSPTLELAIWSERDAYRQGEDVVLYARASADCHLTLVSLDAAGRATVLFPNDLERDNLLPGGSERRVPGENATYRLRAGKEDRETIVGICTMPHQIAEGIRPDYERQRFTSLGSWRLFLSNVLSGKAVNQQGESSPPPRRSRRARRAKPEEKPAPLSPEQHARTAIRFEVR